MCSNSTIEVPGTNVLGYLFERFIRGPKFERSLGYFSLNLFLLCYNRHSCNPPITFVGKLVDLFARCSRCAVFE